MLGLLAEGLTTAQIAERLVLSPRTVDNHVAAVLTRLGVSGRREAVTVASAHGWLDGTTPSREGSRSTAG